MGAMIILICLAIAMIAYGVSNTMEHQAIRSGEKPGCLCEYLNYLGIFASTVGAVLLFVSIFTGGLI